jgi:hypothetical protein
MTAIRTITRLQDADDAPTLGAGQDGYALAWNNATSAFLATSLNADSRYMGAGNQGTYRLHGCVIRSNAGTWEFIEDANHARLGFSGGISQDGSLITVSYGVTASKILTGIVAPDEGYAGKFSFGATMGLSSLGIYCYRNSTVGHKGYLCTKIADTPYFTVSPFHGGALTPTSISWSGGELTIAHNAGDTLMGVPTFDPMGFSVQPRSGRNTVSYTHSYVKFYDMTGTQITDPADFPEGYRFFLERSSAALGYVQLNPNSSELQIASSNLWINVLIQV